MTPFIFAQLGQSLDGRIATLSGESRYINGEAALRHLHRLRASVDAVMVGVGTVVADDPRLTVRLCAGTSPVRVILDPSGRVPREARCLSDKAVRTVIFCAAGHRLNGAVDHVELPASNGRFEPADIVRELGQLGFRRVLIEGGARTVSTFIDAGLIDRLHVMVAPIILGSGKPGLELVPIARLGSALKPRTSVTILADGNVLFDCDLTGRTQERFDHDHDDTNHHSPLHNGTDVAALVDGAVRDPRHSVGVRDEQRTGRPVAGQPV